MYCEYGCGNIAKHQLKNGKMCCKESSKSCPEVIRKSAESRKGAKRTKEQKRRISKAHLGQVSTKKGLTYEEMYGEEKAKQIKRKVIESKKLTLETFEERYPFVFLVDDIIEDKGKIKVRCKNSSCNKYFIPTYIQIYERHRALTKPGGYEENNFYCSEKCKQQCYLYGKTPNSLENTNLYTYEEYIQFKQEVFARQKKQFGYNFCEHCDEKGNKRLIVHHEKPKKTHPHMVLDPDNGIILCERCHKSIHKKGSKCSYGNLSKMICSQEVNNNGN